jgi:hypothetical protein
MRNDTSCEVLLVLRFYVFSFLPPQSVFNPLQRGFAFLRAEDLKDAKFYYTRKLEVVATCSEHGNLGCANFLVLVFLSGFAPGGSARSA